VFWASLGTCGSEILWLALTWPSLSSCRLVRAVSSSWLCLLCGTIACFWPPAVGVNPAVSACSYRDVVSAVSLVVSWASLSCVDRRVIWLFFIYVGRVVGTILVPLFDASPGGILGARVWCFFAFLLRAGVRDL